MCHKFINFLLTPSIDLLLLRHKTFLFFKFKLFRQMYRRYKKIKEQKKEIWWKIVLNDRLVLYRLGYLIDALSSCCLDYYLVLFIFARCVLRKTTTDVRATSRPWVTLLTPISDTNEYVITSITYAHIAFMIQGFGTRSSEACFITQNGHFHFSFRTS